MSVFHEAAKLYLATGLHPIPCMARGKQPMVSWKSYQDQAPTVEELQAWWTAWPDANVGLVVGRGLMVVDVDGDEGWAALKAAGVEIPADAPVVTTGKGAHVYFAGAPVPNRVGLLPKVDVRSDGGFVVAPPSIHPSGAEYRWLRALNGKLPPAPAALTTLLGRPASTSTAPGSGDWFTQALLGVAEGGRNDMCARLAGRLLGAGVPQDAVAVLLGYWAEHCDPPYIGDRGNSVAEIVDRIAKREGAVEGPPSGIADVVRTAMAEIMAPQQQRHKPASTSFSSIDELLAGGLYPGEYVILGARPSVGKTALVLQIGRLLAKQRTGVLFVSLEMTRTALVRRLLAQESQVRAKSLKTGDLIDLEKQMLAAGAARLSELPIWITSDVRTTDQLAETMTTYAPGTLGLVVVDYLQLMTTAERLRDPRQRVESVSKDLRRLTVQHEIPLIALSSLSRPPKNVKEWEPSLSDLRESGELEHDADVVWLLHRLLDQDDTKFKQAKARDGEVSTADIQLKFNGSILTFEEKR